MAEIEVHHGSGHGEGDDPLAKRVGLAVGIIGVALAVVTIAGHREHTIAVIERTKSNDQWAYYQAKKIREHSAQIGASLLAALAPDPAKVAAASAKFTQDSEKYAKDAEGIQEIARDRDKESQHAEYRAVRFDLGEGFLELGLVMSSLYFMSKRRFFVALGSVASLIGTIIGVAGLLA